MIPTVFRRLHHGEVLVGRDRERAIIDRALTDARAGRGSALQVLGEPGIGKTALLADSARRASGFTILSAVGAPGEEDLAFAALADLLRPVVHLAGRVPDPQRGALLAALALGPPSAGDRLAAYAGTLALLGEAAAAGPVLVLVDDLHAVDEPSRQAVAFCCRRIADDAVVVLGAARAEGGPLPLGAAPTIHLGPLADGSGREVLLGARGGSELAPSVVRRLLRAAGGEPPGPAGAAGSAHARAVRRLAAPRRPAPPGSGRAAGLPRPHRVAAARGADGGADRGLRERSGPHGDPVRARVRRTGAGSSAGRGGGRRAADRARAGRLPPPAAARRRRRPGGRAGAPAGARRAGGVPRPVRRTGALGLAPRRGGDRARPGGGAGPGRRGGRGRGPRRLRLGRRRVRPRGAALDPAGRSCRAPGRRRRQRPRGRPHHLGLRAGARGVVRGAGTGPAHPRGPHHGPGDGHLRGRRRGDGVPRARRGRGDRRRIADAHAGARIVRDAHARRPAGRARHRAAQPQCRRRRRHDGGPARRRGRVHRVGRAVGAGAVRALHAGRHQGKRGGLPDHADADDLGGHCGARPVLGRGGRRGPPGPRRRHRRAARGGQRRRAGGAARARRADGLAARTVGGGHVPRRGGRRARRGGRAGGGDRVRAGEPRHGARLGRPGGGVLGRRAPRACPGRPDGGVRGRRARGLRRGARGAGDRRPEAARAHLRPLDGRRHGYGVGDAVSIPWRSDLVEALVRIGDPRGARALVRSLAEAAPRSGAPTALALLARCRALVEPGGAWEAHFREALLRHASGTMPFEAARTALLYGERLRRERRRAEARAQLGAALEAFEAMGAEPWAVRARAELDASGMRARRRSSPVADRLTPRELQVALAVADGSTNREVAARLFLSQKTVERHLGNVYRKLGLRSRSQLARWFASGADRGPGT